jgi:glyoxylase-like metal-dependent hydrolase (beta-lactamase superfamily II)
MEIKQFEDKNLAHFSYAIVSNGEIALIDPARDPQPYYDFAKQNTAKIIAVIETHPHADFVSSHLEIKNTAGATIYVSKLLSADYPHQTFDEGDAIVLGTITLKSLNTPGHSPDSISIVAIDEAGKEKAVFTGDTLFIGDCGRPDLREQAGAITAQRAELAKDMYHSLRNKLMTLPDDVLVYPAHGAGSLCGKQNRSGICERIIG